LKLIAAIYEDDILNFASDLQDLMKVMKYILAMFLNGSYKLPFGHINNFWKKVPKLSRYNSPNTLRKFFQSK
jgi:hypothetical protein